MIWFFYTIINIIRFKVWKSFRQYSSAQFPLAPELAAEKARKDAAIRDVFTGDSDKFLVIIGPCSADREDAVIDYVNRLAKVQEKVKDKLILVPRIYTNKPRTTGDGGR